MKTKQCSRCYCKDCEKQVSSEWRYEHGEHPFTESKKRYEMPIDKVVNRCNDLYKKGGLINVEKKV